MICCFFLWKLDEAERSRKWEMPMISSRSVIIGTTYELWANHDLMVIIVIVINSKSSNISLEYTYATMVILIIVFSTYDNFKWGIRKSTSPVC